MDIEELLQYYDRFDLLFIKAEAQEAAPKMKQQLEKMMKAKKKAEAPKTSVPEPKEAAPKESAPTRTAPTPTPAPAPAPKSGAHAPKAAESQSTMSGLGKNPFHESGATPTPEPVRTAPTPEPVKKAPTPTPVKSTSAPTPPPVFGSEANKGGIPAGGGLGTNPFYESSTPAPAKSTPAPMKGTAAPTKSTPVPTKSAAVVAPKMNLEEVEKRMRKFRKILNLSSQLNGVITTMKEVGAGYGGYRSENIAFYGAYSNGQECVVSEFAMILADLGRCNRNKIASESVENINKNANLEKEMEMMSGGSLQVFNAGQLSQGAFQRLVDLGHKYNVSLLLYGRKDTLLTLVNSSDRPGAFIAQIDMTYSVTNREMVNFGVEYLAEKDFDVSSQETAKRVKDIVRVVEPGNLDRLTAELDSMIEHG